MMDDHELKQYILKKHRGRHFAPANVRLTPSGALFCKHYIVFPGRLLGFTELILAAISREGLSIIEP